MDEIDQTINNWYKFLLLTIPLDIEYQYKHDQVFFLMYEVTNIIKFYRTDSIDELKVRFDDAIRFANNVYGKRIELPGIGITDFRELSPAEALDQLFSILPRRIK
jgi:hypothetical protein